MNSYQYYYKFERPILQRAALSIVVGWGLFAGATAIIGGTATPGWVQILGLIWTVGMLSVIGFLMMKDHKYENQKIDRSLYNWPPDNKTAKKIKLEDEEAERKYKERKERHTLDGNPLADNEMGDNH